MHRYSAACWKDRAEEIRAIRNSMRNDDVRRIMAGIARDYDRLADFALKRPGHLDAQQAVDTLMSAPFSAGTRKREPEE